MKGIDTNVLVRYIVQDDLDQHKIAAQFLEQECTEKNTAVINGTVLCELVWVLESGYGYAKKEIAQVLEYILETRQFHIHEPDVLWPALRGYKIKNADFADHYIACLNAYYGCSVTVTFDKKAAQLLHMECLQ